MSGTIVKCKQCGQKNRIPVEKQHLQPKCAQCKNPLDLSGLSFPVLELNDGSFHGFVQNASLPVMVDFFSPTCGPCQSMMPVVDSLANRFRGKVIIAKLNTATNSAIPAQFNIRGVPSFFFFKHGKLVDQVAGAVPEGHLEQKLSALGG